MKSVMSDKTFTKSSESMMSVPIIKNASTVNMAYLYMLPTSSYSVGFSPGFVTEFMDFNMSTSSADLSNSVTNINNKMVMDIIKMYREQLKNSSVQKSYLNFPASGSNMVKDILLATLPFCLTDSTSLLSDKMQTIKGVSWVPGTSGNTLNDLVGGVLYKDSDSPIKLSFNNRSDFNTSNISVPSDGYFALNKNTNFCHVVPAYIQLGGTSGITITCYLKVYVVPRLIKTNSGFTSNVFVTAELYSAALVPAATLDAVSSTYLTINVAG